LDEYPRCSPTKLAVFGHHHAKTRRFRTWSRLEDIATVTLVVDAAILVAAARSRSSGAVLHAARAAMLVTTDRVVREARRRIEVGLRRPELLPEAAYRLIPYLAVGLLVFLVVVFVYALAEDLRVTQRWLERPYLFIFPAIGVVAALVAAESVRNRRDGVPFYMVALIFAAAFGTLAISFWPYMIPFSITIEEAAAPHSSLAFMFWGEGIFIFPLMLLYTAISYSVFLGKVQPPTDHY
jgi:hypothetical protein